MSESKSSMLTDVRADWDVPVEEENITLQCSPMTKRCFHRSQ